VDGQNTHPASFRDPSGFTYFRDGKVYRRVNAVYFDQLDRLHSSGLYQQLCEAELLVPHKIIDSTEVFKTLLPRQVDFISYPYEWCFEQLKDAALLTLHIHEAALNKGMILKDASAYNVQFIDNKPVFIDTLSFEVYEQGDPWFAYAQFCRHFLGPLLLISMVSQDLRGLSMIHLDGVPLALTSTLLPKKTHLSPYIKSNIHMHAKSEQRYKDKFDTGKGIKLSMKAQLNIVKGMQNLVQGLNSRSNSQWDEYYDFTNYNHSGFRAKEKQVSQWVVENHYKNIWDVGGNNGHFSRHVANVCDSILCTDIDANAVEQNYLSCKQNSEHNIFPLVIDFANPSAGIGFDNVERAAFIDRIKRKNIDCIIALAIIHHLCISQNQTFEMVAKLCSNISNNLIIEFVSPDDSWAAKLLDSKRSARHLFNAYNEEHFRKKFSQFYDIVEVFKIPDSERTLYLMSVR